MNKTRHERGGAPSSVPRGSPAGDRAAAGGPRGFCPGVRIASLARYKYPASLALISCWQQSADPVWRWRRCSSRGSVEYIHMCRPNENATRNAGRPGPRRPLHCFDQKIPGPSRSAPEGPPAARFCPRSLVLQHRWGLPQRTVIVSVVASAPARAPPKTEPVPYPRPLLGDAWRGPAPAHGGAPGRRGGGS